MKISTPTQFFGFAPGTDGRLIPWNRLLAYYDHLAEASDRARVLELGEGSDGARFVALVLSAPENLEKLDEYRAVSKALADPRGLSEEEINALTARGKAVLVTTGSLHGHEPGAAQMAPVLAWELVVGESEENLRILREVIYIMIPCATPDGQIIWADWNEHVRGTQYEGYHAPKSYNKWMGHSNNRDGVMENCPETRHINDMIFRMWHAQLYIDLHQTVFNSPRTFTPIFNHLMHPSVSPLVMRRQSMHVMAVALRFEEEDFPDFQIQTARGVLSWYNPDTLGAAATFHNTPGLVLETADVRVSKAVYMNPGRSKGPNDIPDGSNPHLWEGGWWTLEDIINREKAAVMASLTYLAANRREVLADTVKAALRQCERGKLDARQAFLIPPVQYDAWAASRLMEILENMDIEMWRAEEAVQTDGGSYPAGTVIVLLNQPGYALVRTLLARENVPDNSGYRNEKGEWYSRVRACNCLPELMNVSVSPTNLPVTAAKTRYHHTPRPTPAALPVNGRDSDGYRLVNALMRRGTPVFRRPDGSMISVPEPGSRRMKPLRAGVLMMSQFINAAQTHSSSEACSTAMVLDRFGFPYRMAMDREFRDGVPDDLDVMVIAGDPSYRLEEGDLPQPQYEPEYQSGLGAAGKENLRAFVKRGGRLLVWGDACEYAIRTFSLSVEEPLRIVPASEFAAYHSALNIVLADDPLTLGMPRIAKAMVGGHPVFAVKEIARAAEYRCVARYPQSDVLSCGLLIGEKYLRGGACVLRVMYGKGEIVLFGFDPKREGMPAGTFKLFFNAMYAYDGKEAGNDL